MTRKVEDFTGKQIHNLFVIGRGRTKKTNSGTRLFWDCICKCGAKIEKSANALRNGKSSCEECTNKEWGDKYKCGEINKHYFYGLKISAQKRKIKFDITIEQIWNLFIKQEKRCALTGILLKFAKNKKDRNTGYTTASLDRIDSTKGYTIDNIQWIFKPLQFMKGNKSEESLILLSRLITEHTKDRIVNPDLINSLWVIGTIRD